MNYPGGKIHRAGMVVITGGKEAQDGNRLLVGCHLLDETRLGEDTFSLQL